MRCIVSSCGSNSDCTSDISFHSFPRSPSVRAVWLNVLNIELSELEKDSIVCSEHFLEGDLYMNRRGVMKVRGGALPIVNTQTVPKNDAVEVKMCRICFAKDCRLYKMSSNKLNEAYKILTGLSIHSNDPLPPYLCPECAHRLLNCIHFRSKSLHAHLILQKVIKKYKNINFDSIMSVTGNEVQVGSHLQIKQTLHYEIKGAQKINVVEEVVDVPDNLINFKIKRDEVTDDSSDEESLVHDETENIQDLCENDTKMDTNDVSSDNFNDNVEYLSDHDDDAISKNFAAKDENGDDRIVNKNVTDTRVNKNTVKDEAKLEDGDVEISREAVTNEVKQAVKQGPSKDKSGRYLKRQSSRVAADKLIAKVVMIKAKQTHPLDELIKTNIVKLRKRFAGDEPVPKRNKFHRKVTHRTVDDVPLWSRLKTDTVVKSFTCHLCNYKTGYKKDLNLHLKIHYDDKDHKTSTIDLCVKSLDESYCTTHSDGEMEFSCDKCKQVFNDKDSLQKHIELTTAGKPHTCDACKKSFKYNFELQRHNRIHTGAKPYSCEVCKKAFHFDTSLTLHLRAIHPNKSVKKIKKPN